MKASTYYLLLQATIGSAGVISPRQAPAPKAGTPTAGKGGAGGLLGSLAPLLGGAVQAGGGLGNPAISFLPAAKFSNKIDLKPELRQTAKRHKARYGPYVMRGQNEPRPPFLSSFPSLDPKGQGFVNIISEGLCSDCTILYGRTGLEFEDGKPAGPEQGLYIHHILSMDASKSGYLTVSPCDYQNTSSRVDTIKTPIAGFIGQGEDTRESAAIWFTSTDGKYNSGFHVGKGDKFMVQADLVNYNNATKNVYITFDIEYIDGIVGQDAAPNLLSVTGCKFAQPKISTTGPAVTESKVFPILVDGTIISAKGHMHNGGEEMVLEVNGKEVCKSKPVYEKDQIVGMTNCDLTIPVKKGDRLTMRSVYDLVKHPLRKGVDGAHAHDIMGGSDVMAMWTMSFALDKSNEAYPAKSGAIGILGGAKGFSLPKAAKAP